MWVKPAPGLKVRDYRTKQLWPEGVAVEIPAGDLVFQTLLDTGDIAECEPDPDPTPEPEPAPAAELAAPEPKGADQ